MIRQASAWGQFWADLSERRVHGGAIFTPLTAEHIRRSFVAPHGAPRPFMTSPYYSLWQRWTAKGCVYVQCNGDTMTGLLRDGLVKTGNYDLRMKIALLAVLTEEIEYRLSRIGV